MRSTARHLEDTGGLACRLTPGRQVDRLAPGARERHVGAERPASDRGQAQMRAGPRSLASRSSGSATPYQATRACVADGKPPRPPVRTTNGRPDAATRRDRFTQLVDVVRIHSAEERKREVPAARIGPARSARAPRRAAILRRRRRGRRAAPRRSGRPRSSAMHAVIGRSAAHRRSAAARRASRDDRNAIGHLARAGSGALRSISTPSMPTPRAPSTSASDVVADMDDVSAGSTAACSSAHSKIRGMGLLEADARAGRDEVEVPDQVERVEQLGQVPDPVAHRPDHQPALLERGQRRVGIGKDVPVAGHHEQLARRR